METLRWRHFDSVLLICTLALVTLGIAMVYSASLATHAEITDLFDSPPRRQALFAVMGILLFFLFAAVDYRFLGSVAPLLFGASLLLLVVVLVFVDPTYGSRRWLDLVLAPFQPSEVAKLILAIVLARFFADRQAMVKRPLTMAVSLGIALVPIGLILLQPNLGTATLLLGLWAAIALIAGVRLRYLAALVLAGLISVPFAYQFALRDYMRDRITAYVDPAADPLGIGYNVLQAEISVGSGGLLGKGFTNGTQSQLHFLRIQRTDYIFSVLGEELGFVGAAVLLSVYLLLLFRGLRAAALSRDDFGRFLAVGIVSILALQIFINVGSNTRLIPVTGLPLPLISFGGSSLMTVLMMLGVLESIVLRHRRLEF